MTFSFLCCIMFWNFIGQFVTILSVNKTRDFGWALCAHFLFCVFVWGQPMLSPFLNPEERKMNKHTRYLAHAAIIAALYAALTHMQNLLLPGSATWAIQMRLSEALCVLAFFTPAAIPGLSLGCLLFNLTFAAALPLDFIIGTAATALATAVMWWGRNWTVKGYPLLGMLLPALCNAVLVGWELTVYIGGGFWLNALYVAIGEAAVLLTLGTLVYYLLQKRGLAQKLFA